VFRNYLFGVLSDTSDMLEHPPLMVRFSLFRRQAALIFTVSSGNREKILFILQILSDKHHLKKNPFLLFS
jgi:hypothetical protein